MKFTKTTLLKTLKGKNCVDLDSYKFENGKDCANISFRTVITIPKSVLFLSIFCKIK